MGRGRQKAKQQKIARKLKYLTTDTDYDELAKELGAQDLDPGSADPFSGAQAETGISADHTDGDQPAGKHADSPKPVQSPADDDLDEYARWAAEAAAKVTSGETIRPTRPARPVRHKPIPIPLPSSINKSGNK